MVDTKQRILDTAERLFGEQGFGATSLRHVIAEAGVNIAAVHYHFGSKEELLGAVVARKVDPINQERLTLLAQASGLEGILEAFLRPALVMAAADPATCKMMGRLHAEGLMPMIARRHFQDVAFRFLAVLRGALPDLPDEELTWRIHFLIGAMANAMQRPPLYPGIEARETNDPELLLRRMVTFFSAAFRVPATQPDNVETKQ
jgi:AcrR family transcriptional regulator